jgi:DNA-binding response OmpR family regulator
MLPGVDGFVVARSSRGAHLSTPIRMLTARDSTRDVVRGLDSGVDDYVETFCDCDGSQIAGNADAPTSH